MNFLDKVRAMKIKEKLAKKKPELELLPEFIAIPKFVPREARDVRDMFSEFQRRNFALLHDNRRKALEFLDEGSVFWNCAKRYQTMCVQNAENAKFLRPLIEETVFFNDRLDHILEELTEKINSAKVLESHKDHKIAVEHEIGDLRIKRETRMDLLETYGGAPDQYNVYQGDLREYFLARIQYYENALEQKRSQLENLNDVIAEYYEKEKERRLRPIIHNMWNYF